MKPLIYSTIIIYPLLDLSRKLFGASEFFQIIFDIILILCIPLFISRFITNLLSTMFLIFSFFLLLYTIILFLAKDGFSIETVFTFKIYLVLCLMLFFLAFGDFGNTLNKNILVIPVLLISSLIFIQTILAIGYGYSFLPSLEHTFRSFGDEEISLFSGPFSSSKKCARYLLFLITIYMFKFKPSIMLLILTGLAISLTGARESMLLFLFSIVFLNWSRIPTIALIILLGFLILSFVNNLGTSYLLSAFSVDEIVSRLSIAIPEGTIKFQEDNLIGLGASVGNSDLDTQNRLDDLRIDITSATFAYDSGILRIVNEVGIIGLFFITFITFFVLLELVRKQDLLTMLLVIFFVVLLIKAHTILLNPALLIIMLAAKLNVQFKAVYENRSYG